MTNDITFETRVQALENFTPPPYEFGRVSYQGEEYATLRWTKNKQLGHVFRIDKDHYRDREGNIKEYNHMDEKGQRKSKRAALNRTFEELRGLIRTNFVSEGHKGVHQQVFITLTYAENMTDEKKLLQDFKIFMQNLRRRYPNDYEYVVVAEPQGRGAWHFHLMLKTKNPGALWIDRQDLTKMWGHGYTSIERLKSDDVGAYYTAYFTGITKNAINDGDADSIVWTSEEIAELEKAVAAYGRLTGDTESAAMKKAHIKGARLDMYPKNFRFYRCSQGVDRPEKGEQLVEAMEREGGYEKVYERAYSIDKVHTSGDSSGEIENLNIVHHATYRKVMPKFSKAKEGDGVNERNTERNKD